MPTTPIRSNPSTGTIAPCTRPSVLAGCSGAPTSPRCRAPGGSASRISRRSIGFRKPTRSSSWATQFATGSAGRGDACVPTAGRGPRRHLFERSRPHGPVIAERNRGPRPVRRGFRQLHDRLEVAEPAGWCRTYRRPTLQLASGELSRYIAERRSRHFAEIDDPLADLSERDPHQPAATLPRAACQCDHRAKCHQVTCAIIDRRDRVEPWFRGLARDALRLTYRDDA